MAIDFPNSPTIGDIFPTSGDRQWRYAGDDVWQTVTTQVGSQGDKGGLRYNFDTTTTLPTPASGKVRFNNSDISLVSSIGIHSLTIDEADVSDYFVDLFDSPAGDLPIVKYYIVVNGNVNNSTTYAIFGIKDVTDNETWLELDAEYVAGTLPDNNQTLVLSLNKVGDIGPTGPTGPGGTYNYQVSETAPEGVNPEGPDEGDTWFNSETGRFYVYYDGYWIENTSNLVGATYGEGGGGTGNITVSETAPTSPSEGDLWFNSANTITYIYFDGFWIEANPSLPGPTGPAGITQSDTEPLDTDALWLDTDDTSDPLVIPSGGSAGKVLAKATDNDYDTAWVDAPSGNVIINGAFDIWQRGATFTNPISGTYTADRWFAGRSGTQVSHVISRQAFSPAEINAIGFGEGEFFLRNTVTDRGDAVRLDINTRIENVRTLAGQTVTLSFWAKADSSRVIEEIDFTQNFGSGGSTAVETRFVTDAPVTSSWARYSFTAALPSISGKTIGSASNLQIQIFPETTAGTAFDIWGVQLEAGSVATPFKRNANSVAGELTACQRYYRQNYFDIRLIATASQPYSFSATALPMRTTPTAAFTAAADYSNNISGTPTIFIPSNTAPTVSLRFTAAANGDLFYGRPYELVAEL